VNGTPKLDVGDHRTVAVPSTAPVTDRAEIRYRSGEESAMSAMGERFLLLEDTADALDAIDAELARQFRLVNGLPAVGSDADPGPGNGEPGFPGVHVASISEDDDGIRVECSCGAWRAEVGWDEIDDLVLAARTHFGVESGSVLDEATRILSAPFGAPPDRKVS
jgi:hypothetical protein